LLSWQHCDRPDRISITSLLVQFQPPAPQTTLVERKNVPTGIHSTDFGWRFFSFFTHACNNDGVVNWNWIVSWLEGCQFGCGPGCGRIEQGHVFLPPGMNPSEMPPFLPTCRRPQHVWACGIMDQNCPAAAVRATSFLSTRCVPPKSRPRIAAGAFLFRHHTRHILGMRYFSIATHAVLRLFFSFGRVGRRRNISWPRRKDAETLCCYDAIGPGA
jgi:hypothetical protein